MLEPNKTEKSNRFVVFVFLMGSLTMLGPIAADPFLPAMPFIAQGLSVHINAVELSLTGLLTGIALGQIIYGPLSDKFGRRPVILTALSVFVATGFGSIFANDAETLLVLRFLQGLAAASGRILAMAVGRDLYENERLGKFLAFSVVFGAFATMVSAPFAGFILQNYPWWSVFVYMVTVSGLILIVFFIWFPETLAKEQRLSIRPTALIENFLEISRNISFRRNVACGGFALAGLASYLTLSSGILIGTYGVSPLVFGVTFTIVMTGFMGATYTAGRMIEHLGMDKLIKIGAALMALGGVSMLIFTCAGIDRVEAIVGPMVIYMLGFGLLHPQTAARALSPFSKLAGGASSLLGLVQNLMAAMASALLVALSDGTTLLLATAIAVAGVMVLTTYLTLLRR